MEELNINKVTNEWRAIMEDSQTLENLISEEKYEEFLALTESRLIKIESFFSEFDTHTLPDTLMEMIITDIEKIRGQGATAMEVFSKDQTELAKLFKSIQTGKKGVKQYQQA